MITEEDLAKEFTTVVDFFYPKAGELLHHCYVKILNSYWGRPPRHLQYVGIYCPKKILVSLSAQKDVLKEIAQNMGLAEVVCLNATQLVRDPMSKLKQVNPRFWLELLWIATQEK